VIRFRSAEDGPGRGRMVALRPVIAWVPGAKVPRLRTVVGVAWDDGRNHARLESDDVRAAISRLVDRVGVG